MKKIAFFFGVTFLATCAHAVDFVNGSFETGDFTGWDVVNASQGSWLVTRSNPAGFQPSDGTWMAMFGDVSQQNDTISQVLATDAGQHYILSFDMANIGQNDQWNHFEVKWNNTFLYNAPAPNTANIVPYVHYEYDVVGTGSDVASFAGYAFWAETGVDNIRLTAAAPVPEPMSILALAAGAAALIRRRKAK